MINDATREELLGYLLDALEPQRQEAIERRLAEDASIREALAQLSRDLTPLDATWQESSPPPSLAARTCDFITDYQQKAKPTPLTEPPLREPIGLDPKPVSRQKRLSVSPMHQDRTTMVGPSRFRPQDVAVGIGILIAGFTLLFPAIHGSRVQARMIACQENLRQLGESLTAYSLQHDGCFPEVPQRGKLAAASIYAPILASEQYLPEPNLVVCPGSSLADKASSFSIPMPDEIRRIDSAEQLRQIQERMGGSYGYSFGHMENGSYRPTRNQRRAHFALVSDAPESHEDGKRFSSHHGQEGQNVLFEDGHVRFLQNSIPEGLNDDLFVNDAGQVTAGLHRNDAVIGAGAMRPVAYVSGNEW